MQAFPSNDRDIQCGGVWAIRTLALNRENGLQLGKSCGACGLVCRVMRTFPNDEDVQYRGIRVISTLAIDNEDNRKQLGDEACTLICSANRVFPNDQDAQIFGFRVLMNSQAGEM